VTERLQTEVLVVGSGPGGAITASRLAEAGRDVTIVEEGAWLPTESTPAFSRAEMIAKYRDRGMTMTLGAPPINYVEARCAGGGSEVNSALYHRPPPELVAEWRDAFAIEDFEPEDLTRWAEDVERSLAVNPVPGAVPPSSAVLERGAERLGWNVVEVPRLFDYPGGASGEGVKQTMTRTLLPRATAAGARLLTGCRVRRITTAGRRATGAITDQSTIEADHVFVCAGAIQTPALLQRSGVRRRIGTGLKVHPTVKLAARFAESFPDEATVPMHQVKQFAPDLTLGGSASSSGYVALALADNWAVNGPDAEDWARVGVYYGAIRSDGKGRVTAIPGLRAPVVTYGLTVADLSRLARGAVALGELLFEAGAQRLYPSVANAAPIDSPKELVRLWDDVTASRASVMTIHLLASVRMGERTDRAGADSFGRVHGFDNLYVNDASLVPDAPGVNPQGTIMAIAARNCDRFLRGR
jgi:choline dehydrogenase-like flavoprotein